VGAAEEEGITMLVDRPKPRRSPHVNARRSAFASMAAVLAVAGAIATAVPAEARHHEDKVDLTFSGELVDFTTTGPSPFDGASARLVMASRDDRTLFILIVTGVSREAAGETFGAHLHEGSCVAADFSAAGPHYNQSRVDGGPLVVSAETEVWLDVTITPGGTAVALASVPFVPTPGNRSIVLHAEETSETGTAGARLACLPVSWS
jgi:Cu-Zn family superoxide dismutase